MVSVTVVDVVPVAAALVAENVYVIVLEAVVMGREVSRLWAVVLSDTIAEEAPAAARKSIFKVLPVARAGEQLPVILFKPVPVFVKVYVVEASVTAVGADPAVADETVSVPGFPDTDKLMAAALIYVENVQNNRIEMPRYERFMKDLRLC